MTPTSTQRKKIGVVLFQLGGPDGPSSVEPFLYNLFTDADIIDFPLGWLLRRPLARYVSRRRAPKVIAHYAEIGGRSPLLALTGRQARALENALSADFDAHVVIAMRYWHPFTDEAVARLNKIAPEEIVLLPLYPQYSLATTGSSLNEWKRQWKSASPPVRVVEHFYEHPDYIAAVVEKIKLSLTHFDDPAAVHLLFSAHGLPVRFIERGDPYQRQVEESVRLVMAAGGWKNPHSLCYQSKVGPQKWLEPSIHDEIHRLAGAGVKNLLVSPIAFVSEHIETLHEINIETREEAVVLGITNFSMMPAVGDSPRFIACLADLIRQMLRS